MLLTFARSAGFAARAPGFGHPSVPRPVRVIVALGLTLGVAPGVRAVRAPQGLELLLTCAAEAVLGAAIGAFAALLYDGAYAGGRIVDDYTGVRAWRRRFRFRPSKNSPLPRRLRPGSCARARGERSRREAVRSLARDWRRRVTRREHRAKR